MALFQPYLEGGNLRSLGKSGSLLERVQTKHDFDELFEFLFADNRLQVMRAADVIEKVSRQHPEYLYDHKSDLFELSVMAKFKELQWHLAQLLPRLVLTSKESRIVAGWLFNWLRNKDQSRMVRVNALQAIYELSARDPSLLGELQQAMKELEEEHIPSLSTRIKKLKREREN